MVVNGALRALRSPYKIHPRIIYSLDEVKADTCKYLLHATCMHMTTNCTIDALEASNIAMWLVVYALSIVLNLILVIVVLVCWWFTRT